MIDTKRPRSITSETSRNAVTSTAPCAYRLVTRSSRIIASIARAHGLRDETPRVYTTSWIRSDPRADQGIQPAQPGGEHARVAAVGFGDSIFDMVRAPEEE